MSVFSLFRALLLLTLLPAPNEAGNIVAPVSRVCYGALHASQADCHTNTERLASGKRGQGLVVLGEKSIAFDIVGDSSTNVARNLQHLRRVPLFASISDADRALPLTLAVSDASTPAVAKWTITLSSGEFVESNAIMIPRGRYQMVVSAPHYRSVAVAMDASVEKPDRASVVMRRIPTISGRVLTWSGVPAFFASIQPLPGKHVWTTNAAGTFVFDAEDEWPSTVRITYPGAGAKVVATGASPRDVRFGDIPLQPAVGLKLSISAPPPARVVSASIFHEGDGLPVEVATRTVIVPTTEPTLFTGFEKGEYRLVLRGERPLQQYSRLIRLADSETSEKVVIRESQLALNVTSGGQPEPDASVTLKSIGDKWRGSLTVDQKGSAVEPLWQTGEFSFDLRAKGSSTPTLGHGSLADEDSLQWTLELPAGRIEGRVLDEGDNGIAGATVALTSDDGEMQTAIHTTSDSHGGFVFDHVRYGAQTLMASSDKFLPGEPAAFPLSQTATGHFAELRLKKGTSIRVSVVDRHGVPHPKAVLFEVVDNAIVNTLETDPSGDADMKMPENGGSVVLIAVPASGSFGVRRIGAVDRDMRAVRINVSDGTGSLQIKSETGDHTPIRDVHFLVRYDGETIPFEVLMQLAQWRIVDFRTGADGMGTISNLPPGMYEFWPYAKMTDVDTLMAGMDVPAPLRVALGDGLTSATMTFRKKSH